MSYNTLRVPVFDGPAAPSKRLPFARGKQKAAPTSPKTKANRALLAPSPPPSPPSPQPAPPTSTPDFGALDAAAIAARVARLGASYQRDAPKLETHACDGRFLLSLAPAELDETLSDLGFDRTQRRRIYFELDLDRAQTGPAPPNGQ